MPIETQVIRADDPRAISLAGSALREGELVALPTDTVYGLAANVWNGQAIDRLFEAKGRDPRKSVAVLLDSWDRVPELAQTPPERVRRLASRYWPGPLTLVVRRLPSLPPQLSASDKVGLRVPDHPFALALLAAAGPLAVTSANRSGAPDARTPAEVAAVFSGRIAVLVDGGPTAGGVPSTVVDCSVEPPVLLRAGPIPIEEIEALLGS